MKSIDIRDVPCGACQEGYGQTHYCDAPRYCACDQATLHTNEVFA